MKKLGVLFLLLILLVSSFVSAQPRPGDRDFIGPLADVATSFYDRFFEPFAKFLLGGNTVDGEMFFAKLLLFILIASLVWYAADKFPPTTGKRALLVSAIVSILSVRYITQDWIDAIIMPYTALGITITALVPLGLFFFFVESGFPGQPMVRKICWVFAAVVFVGLFLFRVDGSLNVPRGDILFKAEYIYLYSSIACILFLAFDKSFQKWKSKGQYASINENRDIWIRSQLSEEYSKVRKNMTEGNVSASDAKALIRDIRKRAKDNGIDERIFELPG